MNGGNTLAWVLVVVVLLFVFGIASCQVNVVPGEPAAMSVVAR